MAQYCFSHSRGFTRLAISEDGRPRDVAHDEQNGCYGALSLKSSKSDAIKILLVETTRLIQIYHLPSGRRRPMCPATARKTQPSRASIKLNGWLVCERDGQRQVH